MGVYKNTNEQNVYMLLQGFIVPILEHKNTILSKIWKSIYMNLFRAASNTELYHFWNLFLRTKFRTNLYP